MVQGHTGNAANPDLGAPQSNPEVMRFEKNSSLECESAKSQKTRSIICVRRFPVARPFLPKTRPAGHGETGNSSAPGLASQSVLKTCFGNGLGAGTMLPLSRIKG
jgi:hypothetical protein